MGEGEDKRRGERKEDLKEERTEREERGREREREREVGIIIRRNTGKALVTVSRGLPVQCPASVSAARE